MKIQIQIVVIVLFSFVNSELIIPKENKFFTGKGKQFYGFRGIRYAEPAVGSLRFKDPVPYKPMWTELNIQNTSKDGNRCPSAGSTFPDEDCLFLNVYTQNLTQSRPVIVYIHAGGFYLGSGNSDVTGPHLLMEEEIVLVTFNYRLGFFGFTSTGSNIAPGNAGLKDQVMVLRWIRNNVHYFGGNPNCVTLMGTSAGAMSVALHMVSPMSVGLFHRAIISSGGIIPQLKLQKDQLNLLQRHANLVECQTDDWFACLNNTNTSTLSSKMRSMFEFGHDNPIFLWLPVIENDFGQERFLTEDPFDSIRGGKFSKISILTGVTANELGTSAYDVLRMDELRRRWENQFSKVAPICLHYERDSAKSLEISQKIYEFYGGNDYTFEQLNNCFSDAIINFGVHHLARLIATQHLLPAADVFYYKFNYRGNASNFPRAIDDGLTEKLHNISTKSLKIVEHCDDLQYIFSSNPERITDTSDAIMTVKLTNLLANFAKNGIPTLDLDEHFEWPSFTVNESYVRIDKTIEVANVPFERYDFWKSLLNLTG